MNQRSEAWKDADKICSMYIDEYMSSVEISKVYKCSYSTILKILRSKDTEMRYGPYNSTREVFKRSKTKIWEKSDEICKLFTETNLTCVSLGEIYDVSYQTIRRILKHNNIERRHRIWNYQDDVCDMYENRKRSPTQIAKHYKSSIPTVMRVLKYNNIYIHPYGNQSMYHF